MSVINQIWLALVTTISGINTSLVGIFRRIVETIGSYIDIVRLEILRSEQTIAQSAPLARITSRNFFLNIAYQYQEGDPLVVVDPATQWLGYNPVDPNKRIIKQASIGFNQIGNFGLNVATTDADGMIVPLTQEQLNDFREYYLNYTPLGVQISISSQEPVVLTSTSLYITVYSGADIMAIHAALRQYMRDLQLMSRERPIVFINELECYLKSQPGIHDATFSNLHGVYEGADINPIPTGEIELPSGYFNIDPDFYNLAPGYKTVYDIYGVR